MISESSRNNSLLIAENDTTLTTCIQAISSLDEEMKKLFSILPGLFDRNYPRVTEALAIKKREIQELDVTNSAQLTGNQIKYLKNALNTIASQIPAVEQYLLLATPAPVYNTRPFELAKSNITQNKRLAEEVCQFFESMQTSAIDLNRQYDTLRVIERKSFSENLAQLSSRCTVFGAFIQESLDLSRNQKSLYSEMQKNIDSMIEQIIARMPTSSTVTTARTTVSETEQAVADGVILDEIRKTILVRTDFVDSPLLAALDQEIKSLTCKALSEVSHQLDTVSLDGDEAASPADAAAALEEIIARSEEQTAAVQKFQSSLKKTEDEEGCVVM